MSTNLPEIYVDVNARLTENGYRLTDGSYADLRRLGLTVEQAVGTQFLFNSGEDEDDSGNPADLVFTGSIVKDEQWGYLAIAEADSFSWRSRK
jgi:hypothetical protein